MESSTEQILKSRLRGTAEATYVGKWTPLGRAVFLEQDGMACPLRLSESPLAHGYAWGRTGTVPREVARAILLDATHNEMLAERLCRPLTWEVIARLPAEGFRITRTEILAWVEGRAALAA